MSELESAKRTLAYSLGRKPQEEMPNKRRAREAGDSTSGSGFFERAFARFAGSNFLLHDPWGLRPRLYASVRFADSTLRFSSSGSKLGIR